MCGIKIPLHDFALKKPGGGGGLCARGGVFAGHYGTCKLVPDDVSPACGIAGKSVGAFY